MNNYEPEWKNDKPKYKGKYRVDSTRLPAWNYASNGAYFLTLCTQGKKYFFGEVVQGEMQLSPVGEVVQRLWGDIPNQFSNCDIDVFCVMPNHIHGILIINQAQGSVDFEEGGDAVNCDKQGDAVNLMNSQGDAMNRVSTRGGVTGLFNPMLSKNSVSKILRWYKGRCTFEINQIYQGFGWQERFHDEIIRDQFALDNIRQYIINNPINWHRDRHRQPH
ncbi:MULTISPECIES: transposase [Calothrix]|uniref:Transposase n=2 Tax=Calothrix TaxID=1186 RepID=A0ABR8AH11_9CYAN|nr:MULTISPECIES: transposase [Calothrix]MBD2198810.1 transposase [Calothrix parietina FACHB-288]MBD2227150.1 transposase [Calothrix anomala FACHB-343]